jgi:GNAT superfamily N-acetyltransferase
MTVKLRRGGPADAKECGRIVFEAFKSIATKHNFPQDFTSPEVGAMLMSFLLGHTKFYSVVAELDGRIVGSNFLDERSEIAGVGPISVDPIIQGKGFGRTLMEDVLARAKERKFPGVRLAQAAYNNQTLCLYTKLGFRTRGPLSIMRGSPPKVKLVGYECARAAKMTLKAAICYVTEFTVMLVPAKSRTRFGSGPQPLWSVTAVLPATPHPSDSSHTRLAKPTKT